MKEFKLAEVKKYMCATQTVGTDRWPYVVVDVSPSGKTVFVVEIPNEFMNLVKKHPDGYDYVVPVWMKYFKDESMIEKFTYRKNGKYMPEGKSQNSIGSLHIGYATFFRDPEF